MNDKRRKALKNAIKLLEQASDIVNDCCAEEEEAMDNIPESLQDSDRYMTLEENVDALSQIPDNIEDVINSIEDVIGV